MKKYILALLFTLFFASHSHAAYTNIRMPSGSILEFAGSSCPNFTLLANGASLLRTGTYANLFAAIGILYGSIDGTHFTIPNAQGVFLRGAGSQVIGGLTYSGTLAVAANDTTKKNGLTLTDPGHAHNYTDTSSGTRSGGTLGGGTVSTSTTTTSTTGIVLNGGDAETRPANISVLYCLWY